jgi:hypothetical protein
MKQYKVLLFAGFLCVLFGCRSIEAAFPELESTPAEPFSPELSVMNVQLEVDMSPFFKMLEKETPQSFTGGKSLCEGVSYDYDFNRSAIEFATLRDEVNYTIRGGFGLELNYCPLCVTLFGVSSCSVPRIYGSCGVDEPRRRYAMKYGTNLKLNNDYSLSSSTKLKSFIIQDPCEITFMKFDVTEKVKKEIQNELKSMAEKIDQQISEIDLKSKMDSAWSVLSQPLLIDSYGFLHINPQRISISDLTYKNKMAFFNLNLFFAPVLTTNKNVAFDSQLGQMEDHQKVDGFNIVADIQMGYDSISSILTNHLYDSEIPIKNKILVVKELSIVGSNDGRLIFRVAFEGFKKGTIYLTGVPKIDSVNQVLTFSDLDFEIKTKSLLLKSSQWLLNKNIINEIKQKATIDLSVKFLEAKASLKEKLSGEIRDGIYTETKLEDLRVSKLLLTSEQITIRTNLTGNLKIRID